MRNASALFHLAAPLVALGVLVGGWGLGLQHGADTDVCRVKTMSSPPAAGAAPEPDPESLPPCSVYRNPASGRDEVILEDAARTALLIGDSQSEPVAGWPREALGAVGYDVFFCGAGGTGFVAANDSTGNYLDALQRGDWKLPYGTPPLVVIQGGGNDATKGVPDEQIIANAEQLVSTLRQRYPESRFAMIGTLARGTDSGGGRRTEVDTLLGGVAARQGIPFVSVGDWMTRYEVFQFADDGIHLSTEGHKELTSVLGARLKELGLEARSPDRGTQG